MKREDAIKAVGAGRLMHSMAGKAYDLGHEQGYAEGYKDGSIRANEYNTTIMVSLALYSLHEVFGFGQDRLQRFVQGMWKVTMDDISLSAVEMREDVMKRWGIDVGDPLGYGGGFGGDFQNGNDHD